MVRPIAVGLDGSHESVSALDWAAREAARRGLPLRLVHAWEGMPNEAEPVSLPELKVPQSRARTVLRTAVDRVRAQYPQVFLTAEPIRRLPVPALVTEAESAELLVLGSQGFGGLGGLLAGSVATAVVGRARTPVVLVRAGFDAVDEHVPNGAGQTSAGTPYRPVALALDLAHECDSLLDFAFEAARHRAAPLYAVYAWRLPHTHADTGEQGPAPGQGDAEWALGSVLDPWRDKYPEVTVHAEAEHTRPVHAVLRAAEHAGLLVLGREMRRGTVGAQTGHVTRMAIQHVSCPIAVVAHG
ncbi:universal stress protein [Streptomyces flavofungini]|uniref:Universal stress protein n=1 Tax=Streptomyces flavofungini TaxID=68200 RepID=A0ABS0XHJ9_9ACTN|nr:universal stress protein [Streptomyces flavofungini]MBJ3812660.1 universal stress protein [Streptomyces flavofungini]GHC89780.1 stress-inducible protein [Streptomyces flavofungini]